MGNINIGAPVESLSQVWNYPDLTVGASQFQSGVTMNPLDLPNGSCNGIRDCSQCTFLVHDTAGNVQTVFQNKSPMAVVCGGSESEPLVYLKFLPKL